MSEKDRITSDPVQVAREIAAKLDAAGCEYAIGGAIALGFWTAPRGTLDVDLTLFLRPDQPSGCVRLLQQIGCEFQASEVLNSLTEHGFCQVEFAGRRIDVFLPIVPFYEQARLRRKQVLLGNHPIMIWDAATLCVFKMMFFRRKDVADVEQLLRVQRDQLDTSWVLNQITELYGPRDPRVAQWNELISELRDA